MTATGLACSVAERRLFKDLDVVAEAGDLVEVRGANGAGKSTLLRGLAGLHEFQAGRVRRAVPFEYLGHRVGLSDRLTPVENLRWLAGLRGPRTEGAASAREPEIRDALARLGLQDLADEPCATLSAGQRRRAALARLAFRAPPLWLLDEPLAALDDAGAALVRQLIADHRAAGGAAVCATHQSASAPGRAAGKPSGQARETPSRIVSLGP